jgi:GTPase SAR1 family protein
VTQRYLHLTQEAEKLLDGSDLQRIRYIQRDRFIPYRAINSVIDLMTDFVERPPSIRPPCLALVGDSGCGKTTLMEEFVRRYENPLEPSVQKVIYCTLDPLPELGVSQQALLTALGVPVTLSASRPRIVADDLIGRALRQLQTRLVIFDETLHLHNLRNRQLRLQWDWIKWVSTANRVSLACTGIPGFEQFIRDEAQLQTRFSIMTIPRWTPGPAFSQFLTSFEQSLPLKRQSGLGSNEMQLALLKESGLKQTIAGITQGIKQVLEDAAIKAIRTGVERIDIPLPSAWQENLEAEMRPRVGRIRSGGRR